MSGKIKQNGPVVQLGINAPAFEVGCRQFKSGQALQKGDNMNQKKERQTFPKAKYPKDRPRDAESIMEWLFEQPDYRKLMNDLAEYDKTQPP